LRTVLPVPVQWASWLAFTRAAPPTLEVRLRRARPSRPSQCADDRTSTAQQELEADRSRRTILAERVALLEAKDAEERVRQQAKLEAERQAPAQQRLADPPSSSSGRPQAIDQQPPVSSSQQAVSPFPSSASAPTQTSSSSRPDLAPTPPTDPLRAASQRALREQVVNSGTSRAERQGRTAEGLPKRAGGEEWKPQGWSGKVSVRRGE
jgi:hypothetical protein